MGKLMSSGSESRPFAFSEEQAGAGKLNALLLCRAQPNYPRLSQRSSVENQEGQSSTDCHSSHTSRGWEQDVQLYPSQ